MTKRLREATPGRYAFRCDAAAGHLVDVGRRSQGGRGDPLEQPNHWMWLSAAIRRLWARNERDLTVPTGTPN